MNKLLRQMLCTDDTEVFECLVSKGWPDSMYNTYDARLDVEAMTDEAKHSSIKEMAKDYPVLLFRKFPFEVAKMMVIKWPQRRELLFFAKEFMTRGFTMMEIKDILELPIPLHENQKQDIPARRTRIMANIDIVNSVFP